MERWQLNDNVPWREAASPASREAADIIHWNGQGSTEKDPIG